MSKWIQIIINVAAAVLSPLGIAWLGLMKKSYDAAKAPDSDGGCKITWWEIRGMFIDAWKNIPDSIKEAIKSIFRK